VGPEVVRYVLRVVGADVIEYRNARLSKLRAAAPVSNAIVGIE
jgi:hypothetical protein